MNLILASASPRRQQLLTLLQRPFEVCVTAIPEQQNPGESAHDYVLRLAIDKATAGQHLTSTDHVVIGCDTIVVNTNQVLEKPRDKAHFTTMLQSLSGGSHQVLTAVAVKQGEQLQHCVVNTQVTFKVLSAAEIEHYWNTGEPIDKAGGYGIQGYAGKFVTHISGSYFAVVGLPLYELETLLQIFEADNA